MSPAAQPPGVSCEACAWMLDWLEAQGGSVEEWILDLPVRSEELRRSDGRVSWEIFLTLCSRLASTSRPRWSPRRIGGALGDRLFSRPELMTAVAGCDWADLYADHTAAIAGAMFPGLGQHVEKLSAGRTAMHLELPAGNPDARDFFELVAGVLERAPQLRGLAPAVVAAKLSRRSARFTLRLPSEENATVGDPLARSRSASALADDQSERMRRLVENIEEIVCEVATDGRLVYVSPSVLDLLGFPAEHFRGKHFVEFLLTEERPEHLESFVKMIRSGATARVAFQAPCADGSRIWLEASARPFREAGGEQRIACVLRDVTERTHEEESLRASEERYRAVVENSSDLMGVSDPAGRLRATSPVLMRLLGPRPHDGAQLELARFVHAEDRGELTQAWSRSALSGEPGGLDVRLIVAESEPRWFDVRWSPFRGREDEVLLSLVMRDIGARRHSEDSLRAIAEGLSSEEAPSFAALAEQLAGALQSDTAFIGRLTRGTSGSCETVAVWSGGAPAENFSYALEGTPCGNVAASELCCYPSGVQQLFPGDDALVQQSVEGYIGMPLRNARDETIGLMVGLSRQPIADPERARSFLRILGKRAALELERESQSATTELDPLRRQLVVENPTDLISEIREDGRILVLSSNFEQILGRERESVVGTDLSSLFDPADRTSAARALQAVVDGQRPRPATFRFRRGDGSYRWLESSGAATVDSSGRKAALMISRDVTARMEAEEDRRLSAEASRELERMEAVARLAGGVAHDFNNLLTAITGYGGLVLEALGDDPSGHDAREILNAAKRGETLTRQLLAFSRRQVLQATTVDVNALVASLDRVLRGLMGDSVEVATRLDDELWNVRADPGQLEQVILNLAVNARDAMEQGGRIAIETANISVSESAATPKLAAGEYVSVIVGDTGSGMDAMTQARIFEPFFTTKERDKSSGLGLSMAYGIVRQSGGTILVESELGSGTRFRIYLPRIDCEDASDRRRSLLERFRGDETVLVVEDSDPVRQLVARYLGRLGYRVLSASDWDEALVHCQRHADAIDLLITDLVLPKLDGIEVARRALELLPELRVLYMSGFSGDLVQEHEKQSSDFVLLEKPFTPSMLLQAVRERLDAPAPAAQDAVD